MEDDFIMTARLSRPDATRFLLLIERLGDLYKDAQRQAKFSRSFQGMTLGFGLMHATMLCLGVSGVSKGMWFSIVITLIFLLISIGAGKFSLYLKRQQEDLRQRFLNAIIRFNELNDEEHTEISIKTLGESAMRTISEASAEQLISMGHKVPDEHEEAIRQEM